MTYPTLPADWQDGPPPTPQFFAADQNKIEAVVNQHSTDLTDKAGAAITITGTKSLIGGGALTANRTIELDGDQATPGNSKQYGTNASGVKGWYDIPAGGGGGGTSIVACAPPATIGVNNDAEAGTTPTNYFDIDGTGGVATIAGATAAKRSGTYGIRLTMTTGSSDGSGIGHYMASPISGTSYRFAMWVRPSVTANIKPVVSWRNASAVELGLDTGSTFPCPANTWTQLSMDADHTSGTLDSAYLEAIVVGAFATGATLDWDDSEACAYGTAPTETRPVGSAPVIWVVHAASSQPVNMLSGDLLYRG